MPYRPEQKQSFKNGDTPPWLGYQNTKILSFKDESDKYDWADVYLVIEMQTAGSEFPVRMRINGSFERDEEGFIMNNSLLKKFYSIADAVGFGGGFDKAGDWVTKSDEGIEDIAKFLNNNYTDNSGSEIYPYTIYVYKTKVMDKQSNEEKVWTRVVERMAKSDNQKQMKSLESYVKWAKDNDVIKEHVPEENTTPEPWDKASAPSVKTVNSYKVG
jgi:hypothetical protein|tara:strand:+ start:6036 stop:6680 length:645 start_codon:yes stop_codon:yes gene_type:complete